MACATAAFKFEDRPRPSRSTRMQSSSAGSMHRLVEATEVHGVLSVWPSLWPSGQNRDLNDVCLAADIGATKECSDKCKPRLSYDAEGDLQSSGRR